ncbi:hypothetical protein H1R20_g13086, partial [Candolleomyces eurysporus]
MRFLHAFAAVIGGGSPGDESGDDEADPTTAGGGGDTGAATAEEYDTSTFEFSEVEPDSPHHSEVGSTQQESKRCKEKEETKKKGA